MDQHIEQPDNSETAVAETPHEKSNNAGSPCAQKKRIPPVLLVFLLLASAIVNGFLFARMIDAEKRASQADEMRIDLPPELQLKIADGVNAYLEKKMARVETSEADKAAEAFEVALRFAESKDLLSAKMHCLNAINHAPERMEYFFELMKIQKAIAPEPSLDDLEQIRGILEMGVYQVDSKDIPAICKMLQDMAAEMDSISAQMAKQESKKRSGWQKACCNF